MATSYSNSGGSGNREFLVHVKGTNVTNNPSYFVNGNLTDTNPYFGISTGVIVEFWFASKKIIDEAKFYQQSSATQGTWKWQGSNDRTSWTDIGSSFALGGVATQTITALSGNTTAYIFYRIFQVSGTTNSGPYIHEFEFKIDDESATTASYLHALGRGDRTSSITVASSGITWSGSTSALVNGVMSGEAVWDNATVTGHWISFDMAAAVIVQQAKFYITGGENNQGNWKFQGSTDSSTWTDLSGVINLGLGITTVGNLTVTYIGGFESNTTEYRYYRLLGTSGSRNNGRFEVEVEFMVADAPAPPASAVESIQFSVVRPD